MDFPKGSPRRFMARAADPKLDRYRDKRRFSETSEPAGGKVRHSAGPLQFVVHHHGARSTHYDLRLEFNGVLRSWAVPKGPSPDQAEKRFAALVEDHPLEYADFEGRIPDGNYGAGWTIVWDRGAWKPLEDPITGFDKGKLLFELQGTKLKGRWTLVRIKNSRTKEDTGKDWLLIKERDDQLLPGKTTSDYPMGSVFSGLSLDDLNHEVDVQKKLQRRLRGSKAPDWQGKFPGTLKPMLAASAEPFDHKDWVFEAKYDGYRMLAVKQLDQVQLLSRNGNNLAPAFPEIADLVSRLPFDNLIIDAEAIVPDENGIPDFDRIQKRGQVKNSRAVSRLVQRYPATLYCFDLLALEGKDLRKLPLSKRKKLLQDILPAPGLLKLSEHIKRQGQALFTAAAEMGLEGIVAKRADSLYQGGRSSDWLKCRVDLSDDFVISGYRVKASGHLRSLSLAQYLDGKLVYRGNVGSGLDGNTSARLEDELGGLKHASPPLNSPSQKDYIWVKPELVCEVQYKTLTSQGQLRHPVFLRLRSDKIPEACTPQDRSLAEPAVSQAAEERQVTISNPDKVFWPKEGYSKGDLLDYYEAIAPWLLPWLKDRPLVLTRYPDGIEGKSFFQKDAPAFAPEWMKTVSLWSESTERELCYFVVDSLESLLYIANMATIPIHIQHARLTSPQQPDWCVLDLDPKDASFEDVITIAKAIRSLCEDIGLDSYVKTTGSTGLHILIPLQQQLSFDDSRVLGELLARVIVQQLPDIATTIRTPSRRKGRVYVDFLQNGAGKLIAAPYCLRPLPGAPVAMPLRWHEVNKKLKPDSYHIRNATRRMARLEEDPNIAVLNTEVDILVALEALSESFTQ